MRVTVVGKENVNYIKQGNPVQGIKLHVTYPNTRDGAEGLACDAPYFGSRYDAYHQAALVKVGDIVDVFYNQYGRIDTLEVVPPSPAPAATPDKK